MPKVYSDNEKLLIKKRLHDAANKSLLENGVRKTTVDELVQKVGIPKGTFYLFYKSKEELLFEVILEYHEIIENKMLMKCRKAGNSLSADKLADIVTDGILGSMNSCLKTIMVPGEIEIMIEKLPADIIKYHLGHDEDMMINMLKGFNPHLTPGSIKVFSAAFHEIFFACLYKDTIGEKYFRKSIRLLTKGLLLQMQSPTAQ